MADTPQKTGTEATEAAPQAARSLAEEMREKGVEAAQTAKKSALDYAERARQEATRRANTTATMRLRRPASSRAPCVAPRKT